jgi:hypothetical protein
MLHIRTIRLVTELPDCRHDTAVSAQSVSCNIPSGESKFNRTILSYASLYPSILQHNFRRFAKKDQKYLYAFIKSQY